MSEIPQLCIQKEITSAECIQKEITATECIEPSTPISFDYEIYQEGNEIGFVAYNETQNGVFGVIEVKQN